MTSALQLEILDLRHYSASTLRPILNSETRLWKERLHWDFQASADLLLQYLDSRILPGYVAIENALVAGYVFCVYEESKAVIGDVFAWPQRNQEPSAVEIENRLLDHLIELLQNSPGIDRIESQLLLHPHGSHELVFERNGFATHPRLFMELPLKTTPSPCRQLLNLPPGLAMRRWQENDFAAAGRLIAAAYENHLDSHINDQYRSVAGSLRFLHNIVRFPGCGIFDPGSSFVITDQSGDQLAGLLLCSRVCPSVGHVTQICVAHRHRSHGLATVMLQACAENMATRNFDLLTLTVTEANRSAVSLYRSRGFEARHSFDAMVWQRHS